MRRCVSVEQFEIQHTHGGFEYRIARRQLIKTLLLRIRLR